MQRRYPALSLRSQRGAALIVAMLLLLVMTILGVTAMNSSLMQGFMSSSYQNQATRLAEAENLLLAAEREIEDRVGPGGAGFDATTNSYYIDLNAETVPPPVQFQAAAFATIWPANQYVIEYMGEFEVPGESIAIGSGLADSRIHLFRISARATEGQRGGLRIVQSLFVALREPN